MTSSQDYRYVFSYTHPEHGPGHESWLIEWALDWFDHGIHQLTVTRSDSAGAVHARIAVDLPGRLGARHSDLIDQLAVRVDDLDVDCHSIE